MRTYKAVVFDLDGLLLDTERVALRSGLETLEAIGHPLPLSVLQGVVGLDSESGHKLICGWLQKEVPFASIYTPWGDNFRRLVQKNGIPLRPHVLEVLDALDRLDLPRAVATNSETEDARWKLKQSGLEARFEMVVGRDLAGGSKPAPHVYLHAARLLQVDPEDCLALEDSDTGVRAARVAGMTVVQIPDMVPSQDRASDFETGDLLQAFTWAGLLPPE